MTTLGRRLGRMAGIAAAFGALGGGAIWIASLGSEESRAAIAMVYKSPTCGCCSKWQDHLRQHGFTVKSQVVQDVSSIKSRHGVAPELGSCHTALIGGYVVEGHVPASSVRKLLAERPKVIGIAVPGMPAGSPGMESPHPVAYEVLAFDRAGNITVFDRH